MTIYQGTPNAPISVSTCKALCYLAATPTTCTRKTQTSNRDATRTWVSRTSPIVQLPIWKKISQTTRKSHLGQPTPDLNRNMAFAKIARRMVTSATDAILLVTLTCEGFHMSRLTLRTNEICTPRLRWTPEQSKQMNRPKLTDAHRGSGKEDGVRTLE